MRLLMTFTAAIVMTSCGKVVTPGKSAGGCVGITELEWALLPKGGAIGMNGTMVEWRLKRSLVKASNFPRGGFKMPNAPAGMAVKAEHNGHSAIIITQAPATVSWNNKVLKCKAA